MSLQTHIISSIGLSIDIIGVLILFKYGLPSGISEGEYFVDGEPESEKEVREKRNKFIKRMAYCGLSCLLIGFILQLIGTNITIG